MPYAEINIKSYLTGQATDGHICPDDADLIQEFIEERKATCGLADSTSIATAKAICKFVAITTERGEQILSPLRDCKTSDVYQALNVVSKIWKQNTRRLRVHYLKIFLLWLIEEGQNPNLDPKKIESIKTPKADKATKTASQMISPEDMNRMIMGCKNSRDRAMISLMYEGALRPIEIREATWSQVKFDEYGAVFTTSKKTGKPRYIRIITYAHYLAQWQADYFRGNPDENMPIFITRRGNILSRQYFDEIISKAAEAAGIEKIFPYILRHSRITNMNADGIPESVIKLQAWGSLSTPMMATYCHLSNDQLDSILLEKNGVVKKAGRPKGPTIKPVQCPSCSTINVPGARLCHQCGSPLTDDARHSLISLKDKIKENDGISEEMFTRMLLKAKEKGII
ncbi:site-specific integrase [Methanoplanus limicola]|uniref:Integrase family protein n=1 Tax=Methanoplanus limicola DSM 2279 TaxID=937775 RepID=H1Z175_9EURY|nr:site-specific integrase [Methanoplanus limicola]EHQ35342.1 integrase family protein [Methanoplanus limicola DSM 2279]